MFKKFLLSSIYESKTDTILRRYLVKQLSESSNGRYNPRFVIGSFQDLQQYHFHDSAPKFKIWCHSNDQDVSDFTFVKEFISRDHGKCIVARKRSNATIALYFHPIKFEWQDLNEN